ncbi:MAG: putative DNA-binding domain-containing protein [Rubrivivax sp.]|nr:putative DNA-binding domain-containing protein [Rubrivivax sp.]
MTHPAAPTVMRPAPPTAHAFAAALLDASLPPPPGLQAWNGADPGARFAVYRNNVVHSLVAVLADTFPVVRQLVGAEFFGAMARRYVVEHPPTSPLMYRYGAALPAWIADFEPAAALPCLADLARLEWLRLRAFHAADADPIDADLLRALIASPERLAGAALVLHPSLAVVSSNHPVVSLWAAHQLDESARDSRLGAIDIARAEAGLVFRDADDQALVIGLPPADAALLAALRERTPLGAAQPAHPQADLIRVLSLLLRHGLVTGAVDAPSATRAQSE